MLFVGLQNFTAQALLYTIGGLAQKSKDWILDSLNTSILPLLMHGLLIIRFSGNIRRP
jgi:hypothetical protein